MSYLFFYNEDISKETKGIKNMTQEKLDLKKEQKVLFKVKQHEYKKVQCSKTQYIAIDGEGDPNGNEKYQAVIGALYKMVYSLKMEYKKRELDYVVMPLAGQWWDEEMCAFNEVTKDKWKWTMMIQLPNYVEKKDIEYFKEKYKDEEVGEYIKRLYFLETEPREVFATLYIGAYRDEKETIKNLHNIIIENGYKLTGRHEEIYLSDPRKVDESKLKTIIMQSVIEA